MGVVEYMLKLSRRNLVVALGGLAVVVPLSTGTAAAQPDLGPVVNTTCSYGQVMAALNDQRPDLARQFNTQPAAQAMLSSFLASPVSERQRTVNSLQGNPIAQAYLGPIMQIAGSCANY